MYIEVLKCSMGETRVLYSLVTHSIYLYTKNFTGKVEKKIYIHKSFVFFFYCDNKLYSISYFPGYLSHFRYDIVEFEAIQMYASTIAYCM